MTKLADPMTEEELDELLEHTATGREHTILQSVVRTLNERAGALFAQRKDALATEMRDLAAEFDKSLTLVAIRLRTHTDRSIERAREKRLSPQEKERTSPGGQDREGRIR
ncbi:MAG: hypothetical protein ACHREM_08900 [Polyangiales bacterium]